MKRKITGEEHEKLSGELKALYKKEGDGNYYLTVDEAEDIKAAKAKVDEFRQTNITLKKRIDEFENKFKNIDPEKYDELLQKTQDLEDKKLLEEGEIDKLVEQKTERMRKDYEAKIEALSKDNDRLGSELTFAKGRLNEEVIDSRITKSVSKIGIVKKGAMEDIVSRGRKVWKLGDDGEPIAQKADGSPLFGKDPKLALSFDEWAEGLISDAAYLFEPSEGIHSQGGDKTKPVRLGLGEELKGLPPTERLKKLHTNVPRSAA